MLDHGLVFQHVVFACHICGQTFQALQLNILGLATIAEQHSQVGPVLVGVTTHSHQNAVYHQVHLSEQGVKQEVHRPHWALLARIVVTLDGFDEWPIGSGRNSSGSGPSSRHHWQGSRTPGKQHPLGPTWDRFAPGNHRPCLSARAAHCPDPPHSWCMACRAVACRPEVTSWLVRARARHPLLAHLLIWQRARMPRGPPAGYHVLALLGWNHVIAGGGVPPCRPFAWGLLPSGQNCPWGACQPAALSPWVEGWLCRTVSYRHSRDHGPNGTGCRCAVWCMLPCLSLSLCFSYPDIPTSPPQQKLYRTLQMIPSGYDHLL